MPTILLGLATMLILLWVVRAAARADPKGFVRGARLAGGVAALGGAAFLVGRGQVSIGVPLGLTGLVLLGWLPFGPASFGKRTQKSAGQVSRVRSAFLEISGGPVATACRRRSRRLRGNCDGGCISLYPSKVNG